MGRELFLDFFTEHEVPVIRKRRHTFLKMDDENAYIIYFKRRCCEGQCFNA